MLTTVGGGGSILAAGVFLAAGFSGCGFRLNLACAILSEAILDLLGVILGTAFTMGALRAAV